MTIENRDAELVHDGEAIRYSWFEPAVSIVIAIGFMLTLALLQQHGTASRKLTIGADSQLTIVEDSKGLMKALDSLGARGTVLISVSRFLHFVPTEGVLPEGPSDFPVPRFDLPNAYLQRADHRNSLWTAVELGFAREILHVMPGDEYRERRSDLGSGGPGITIAATHIETHENGSRRKLVDHLPDLLPRAPWILLIHASAFSDSSGSELRELLSDPRLLAIPRIYDLALDNPDVDESSRERLRLHLSELSL